MQTQHKVQTNLKPVFVRIETNNGLNCEPVGKARTPYVTKET